MDHRELKKLVQLMNDNGLVELEIEREGERLHLRKADPSAAGATLVQMPGMMPGMMPGVGMPAIDGHAAGAVGGAEGSSEEAAPPSNLKEIRSPMVGTFYRRPSPDSDPYVDVGADVNEDSVVCIVEAMKVNNEIKAEIDGEIVEVLVEDGQPVEYDQPLFRVRP
jgi:acetyl-CoA carboxylase biotin carboxyl carrier protein